MRMRIQLLLLLWSIATAVLAAPVGWLGDGSGVFRDAHPPMTWNAETGEHIQWKTRLPNWSNSSPIVAGDRVFVMAEPLEYAPILTCIDAQTGAVLWQREIDAVLAFPREQQQELRTLAREGWAWNRAWLVLSSEMWEFWQAHRGDFTGTTPQETVQAPWAAYLARAAALEVEFKGFRTSAGDYADILAVKRGSAAEARARRLTSLGLMWSTWCYQGTWDGVAFPTPVSDGAHVWAVTAHNVYVCYDLEGNLLWMRRFPPADGRALQGAERLRVLGADGRLRWPYGWPGQGHFSTSPVLAEGLLVSNAGAYIRALDARTGETRWEYPDPAEIGQNMANPRVITLRDTPVVLTAASGEVIRLQDGKILGKIPGTVSAKMDIDGPIMAGDVVFHLDGDWRDYDVVATRLILAPDGESVTTEECWRAKRRDRRGFGTWRTVARDGRLYHNGAILDASTGALIQTNLPTARGGYCWHAGIIVGDAFLSMAHDKGRFVFRDLATGKVLGDNTLPTNPPEAHDELRKRGNAHSPRWQYFGAASPFAVGDRLYIRSYDYLWCIGQPAPSAGR